MGKYDKYKLYELYETEDGINWNPLGEYKAILSEEDSADCGYVMSPYEKEYLSIVALEDGKFEFSGSSTSNTISYSTDSGNTWSTPAQVVSVNVNSGDVVMWKGEMRPRKYTIYDNPPMIGRFMWLAHCNVQGNIMSLMYGDDYFGKKDLTDMDGAFSNLFFYVNVENAENLILPAKKLASSCYWEMFRNCLSLTTAPSLLPATTLSENCYASMFANCPLLISTPELPAKTLANYCYSNMFYGCTSLTTAPSLPATILANYCYNEMFYGCNNLTTPPDLKADVLYDHCYGGMFGVCSKLNYIKMLATDISATDCLQNWVNGVAASGTFVKKTNATIPSGNSGIPNGWTVQNA